MNSLNDDSTNQQRWAEMLKQAVSQPGLILKAYSAFHQFSVGNQIAALLQCDDRGIEPGPICTYKGWTDKGRQVRRGEKAIWLCMPITGKKKNEDTDEDERFITRFVWKPRWFVLSQTDGEPVPMPEIPDWNAERALTTLGIEQIPFTRTDGNFQGYAKDSQIAISPIAALPHKTMFHETAHVLLGHTQESSISDSEHTPKSLGEVEAEAVALLLCESLSLPGADYCRGYIQGWLDGDSISEKSAQRVFGAADRILKAGLAEPSTKLSRAEPARRPNQSAMENETASTQTAETGPLFALGRMVSTPGALDVLESAGQTPFEFISRHQRGDWGDCGEADARENDLSVKQGFRIFSVYHTRNGETLWVITEADRSATTVLLPDEY